MRLARSVLIFALFGILQEYKQLLTLELDKVIFRKYLHFGVIVISSI